MTLTLRVYTNNEWAESPELAVVEIDRALAARYVERIRLVQRLKAEDEDVLTVAYRSIDADYYQGVEPNEGGPLVPDGEPQRTEGDDMRVEPDGVSWRGWMKHTDVILTTEVVSLALLEAIASGDDAQAADLAGELEAATT